MESAESARGAQSLEAKRDSTLQSVTAGVSSAATRDDILRAVLCEGGRALGTSAVAAFVFAPDRRSLILVAHDGITDAVVRAADGTSIESTFPVARCMRDGQPLWLDSRERLARDFPDFERAASDAFERRALAALPLRARGEVVAGIGFAFAEAHDFDQGERDFLMTLVERCESALERALLYEESQAARAAAERSRAEAEALLRFNEIVGGILAHDLKNPLAAVLMNARLLGNSEDARSRTIGARIVTSGERMTRMIDQVLDWTRARADAGHVRLVPAACDLGALTDEVVGELRARKSDAAIVVESRGALRGEWDGDRLAQVISNIVGNALDHASGPGVVVRLDGEGADVRLEVENEGHIDDELLPVIFEPFRGRASGSRARGRGLGLGLYITRQIVLAHGGTISLDRGDGTRVVFTVTLPRATLL